MYKTKQNKQTKNAKENQTKAIKQKYPLGKLKIWVKLYL